MKTQVACFLLLSLFVSTQAFANKKTHDFFEANLGEAYYGKNPVKQTDCSLEFQDETYLTFKFDLDSHIDGYITDVDLKPVFMSNKFVYKWGGMLSAACLIHGDCDKRQFTVVHDGNNKVISFEETFNKIRVQYCEF